MLHSLEFENFKSWGGRHRLDLGRITGLFGPNSSGKSSIIHLLLLLKQTVESPGSTVVLNFSDNTNEYIDFGSFVDIITDHDVHKPLSYSLDWTPRIFPRTYHEHSLASMVLSNTIQVIHGGKAEEVIVSRLAYKADARYGDDSDNISRTYNDRFSGLLLLELSRTNDGNFTADVFFQGCRVLDLPDVRKPTGLYRINRESRQDMMYELDCRYDNGIDRIPKSAKHKSGYALKDHLDEILEQAEYHTAQLFQDISYIGPLRSYPHRNYTWTGTIPGTVGHRGEQAMQVLLAEKPETSNAVSKWMRKLGIAESLSLEPVGHGARIWEALVEQQHGTTRVNLADVGFGVSQVLPVIVALLSAQPGSLVILEHPEIHLHPKIQSDLADLLIDIANTGEIQILLESHSEHLLARIQRRIAESSNGEGGMAPEDFRLYFCSLHEGKSQLTPLDVQRSGVIANWPADFFGDILEDRLALGGFSLKADNSA